MQLCVDGRLRASAETGVASYARAVLAALRAVGEAPLILDDAAAGRFGEATTMVDKARRALRAAMPMPVTLRRLDDRLYARDIYRLAQVRFARSGRLLDLSTDAAPGVMHWTYPIPARIAGWINIYTIHDVIPLTTPHLSPVDPASLRRRLEGITRVADRIVTVSAAAREAILATLDIDPERVVDCGNGVADITPDGERLPNGLVENGYFLFCGLIEPRKNLSRIAAAWRASGTALPLVIVGRHDRANAALRGELVGQGAMLLPYQPRGRLMDLVRGARALVFPTLEEGFGLPIAEAMALGTPVLTSNRGALAETAGGAALLVDPESDDAIGAGLRRLDADAALRDWLRAAGQARAEHFGLRPFGRRLTALYSDLAGSLPVAGHGGSGKRGWGEQE